MQLSDYFEEAIERNPRGNHTLRGNYASQTHFERQPRDNHTVSCFRWATAAAVRVISLRGRQSSSQERGNRETITLRETMTRLEELQTLGVASSCDFQGHTPVLWNRHIYLGKCMFRKHSKFMCGIQSQNERKHRVFSLTASIPPYNCQKQTFERENGQLPCTLKRCGQKCRLHVRAAPCM